MISVGGVQVASTKHNNPLQEQMRNSRICLNLAKGIGERFWD
jgi:hypothetical protein